MMRGLVALTLVGLCAALSTERSAAAATIPSNPQDFFLAKQAVGNFGCHVDSVVISTEMPGAVEAVNVDDIRGAFSQVATLEWAHIAQSSFSPLDGRNDEKVLATPGGDMGEFIQALHAYTQVTNKELTEEEIGVYFNKYIQVMTRAKFSYQTDEKSYVHLAIASGCRNLHVADMGGMKHQQEVFLTQVALPEHIGDPFIKFLAINSTELGINPYYIHGALAAYHKVLWSAPSAAASKLCYVEVKGTHKEAALVNIKTPVFCTDQGLAPMISQALTCPAPVLINHPEAAKVLRREFVAVLTQGGDVDPGEVLAVLNSIAENNLERFMSVFGTGLPIFTVEFKASTPYLASKPTPTLDDE